MKIPREDQEVAIAKALATTGFIFGDDTGYGKTVMGIEVAKRSRGAETHWRCLVVCPTKLRAQWASVLADQDPSFAILQSNQIPYDFSRVWGYVVVGYGELLNARFRSDLGRVLWDIVIVDEAHRIKNRKAKSTEYIKAIPRARSLAMTAWPMEKSPEDLWSLLNFVNSYDFQTFWPFANEWLDISRDWMDHWVIGGPKDPERFGLLLSHYLIKRPLVLPYEKEVVDMVVDLDPKQKIAIDKLRKEKDILVKIEDQELLIPNTLALITKLQQMATDPTLLGVKLLSGKFQWLKEFIEDHPEPIIVFTRFREVALQWGGRFDGDIIVGNQGDGQQFISGEKNLIFGTIDAMGEGLDGLQRARYAVFVDAHWSARATGNAMGRIYRTGIEESKVIYMLHSTKEDEMVLKALEEKWTDAELVYYFLHSD
jgi:hypothetical protein